jgi:hypothetical protein
VLESTKTKEYQMAEISFKGFVDRVFPKFVLVSENHQKKDGDNWVSTGRTTYQVWTNYVEIGFELAEGQLVEVAGRFKTEENQGNDGKTYRNNIVSPTAIALVTKRNTQPSKSDTSWVNEVAIDADAPF